MPAPLSQTTGRRKQAVARVWMMPGTGKIAINNREVDDYFGRATSKMIQSVCPPSHHFDTLIPKLGAGVGATHDIPVKVRKLRLDSIRIPFAAFI